MQLAAAKNMATTEDEYLAVVAAKTAALFSAAAEVGPTIAGRGRDDRAAFRSYGTNLGLAFQLIDDALDYGGSSADLGKHVGDDFTRRSPCPSCRYRAAPTRPGILVAGAGRWAIGGSLTRPSP
jgi:geranylgeranyl pyrophosphate synthase